MCDHIAKVLDWGIRVNGTEAILSPSKWGCLSCDQTWDESPSESLPEPSRDISEHLYDCECFGCKARSIRVAYCGQGGGDATAQKKWDRNIDLYRTARKQGIQPTGTSQSKVMAAIKQSEKTGVAFKAT